MNKEDRIKQFRQFMLGTDMYLDGVIEELDDMGFFTAPASTHYHGAYEGGLFDHSLAVAEKLVQMTDLMDLKWENVRSPKIVGMYHDLCKCDSYVKAMTEEGWSYNPKQLLAGHGDKSVILIQALDNIPWLTEEEILCIRYHMGAYEGEKVWRNFDAAIRKYPNVLWTHTADMWASKVLDT